MGFLGTMAAAGRGGDTTVAHMTPGEMVVPKEVAAMRPDLVKHIQSTIASYGVDPSRYVVGTAAAYRNPTTGAQEFATADEIAAAYQSQLGRTADPTEVSFWMNNQDAFSNGGFTQGVANEKAATAQAAAATPAPAPSTGLASTTAASPSPSPSPAPAPATTGTGFLAAASTPAATPAAAAAPALDWASIYRNTANRDASQADIDFWNGQAKTLGNDGAYSSFLTGLTANGETNAGLSLADANKAYTGDLSKDTATTSSVDEWARNLYGRDATAQEIAQYGGATDPQTAQKNYAAFVSANGGDATGRTLVQASQLTPTALNTKISNMLFPPNTQQQVDPATQTIQGQLANILAVDANGNYTNQTVRQAYDRTMQTFAARGLLNTSVAAQAAQEAVIAQAINIAGPDAQTYATQALANQTAQNNFAQGEIQQGYTQANAAQQQNYTSSNAAQQQGYTQANAAQQQGYTQTNNNTANANTLRQNYLSATASISDTYQTTVANINSSAMTPDEKTKAIADAASVRDGEMVYTNSLYSKQPQWQSEWLAQAVPTGNVDVAGITNINTLQNIINDPAQPAATVAAAKQQLAKVSAQAAATPAPAPAAETRTSYDDGGGG